MNSVTSKKKTPLFCSLAVVDIRLIVLSFILFVLYSIWLFKQAVIVVYYYSVVVFSCWFMGVAHSKLVLSVERYCIVGDGSAVCAIISWLSILIIDNIAWGVTLLLTSSGVLFCLCCDGRHYSNYLHWLIEQWMFDCMGNCCYLVVLLNPRSWRLCRGLPGYGRAWWSDVVKLVVVRWRALHSVSLRHCCDLVRASGRHSGACVFFY
jgi:hypothetical protein